MSTDAERREEARIETIADRFDRHGVVCGGCAHLWIPGRQCCPQCGGAREGDFECGHCGYSRFVRASEFADGEFDDHRRVCEDCGTVENQPEGSTNP